MIRLKDLVNSCIGNVTFRQSQHLEDMTPAEIYRNRNKKVIWYHPNIILADDPLLPFCEDERIEFLVKLQK